MVDTTIGLGQTIAVFDKSGKAVSTSKQILNVLKDAKAAYLERRRELAAAREAAGKNAGRPTVRRAYTIDAASVASSHRSGKSHRTHGESRHGEIPREHGSEAGRRHSASRAGSESRSKARVKVTPLDNTRGLPSPSVSSPGTPLPPYTAEAPGPLIRHKTFHEEPRSLGHLLTPRRAVSSDGIDMDLAYGEPPPNLMSIGKRQDDAELSGLVGRVKLLLDEAKCVQHSVTSTIANLQKNPEAMAAVALTLGEISTLVKRMSPGTLAKVRVLAPSVFGLLTSPQFLIAAGVGVGITVIALGGYKVVKKIQAQQQEETPERMIALSSEVSRIETWRQGIAEAETASIGTSVEGEFITPLAANLSRLNLEEESREARRAGSIRSSARSEGHKSSRTSKTVRTSPTGTSRRSRHKDSASTDSASTVREHRSSKDKEKDKKRSKSRPSPLANMFKP